MNRIAFLFLIVLFTSCEYFDKKKINSKDLLEEELQTFNWNDVDTYPTFSSCDSITAKANTTRIHDKKEFLIVENVLDNKGAEQEIRLDKIDKITALDDHAEFKT